MKKLLLVLILALTMSTAQAGVLSPTIRQDIVEYQDNNRTPVPCNTTAGVNAVLVRIWWEGYGTMYGHMTNTVFLDGRELWRQTTQLAGDIVIRQRMIASYVQRLVSPGLWRFDAELSGGARTSCTIRR